MAVLGLFIAFPWLACIVASVFGVAGLRLRVASARVAAVAWLAYGLYE